VATIDEQFDPTDIVGSRITIAENIISSSIQNKDTKIQNAVLEEYKKQDEDLRAISYKILVESFNKKYSNLTTEQKTLLKEYINNINNTGKLNSYVGNEITKLVANLKEVGGKLTDKVTRIKLAETISNVNKIKSVKKIKEEHLSAMMMTYELLGELKNTLK
jgi:chorismate synthase